MCTRNGGMSWGLGVPQAPGEGAGSGVRAARAALDGVVRKLCEEHRATQLTIHTVRISCTAINPQNRFHWHYSPGTLFFFFWCTGI
jgi:hypothetical protein